MTSRSEMLGNRPRRGEKPLRVPRRLEPLHAPLPLARRLVRILCPIVEIAMLAVLHPGQDLPLRRAVALELIGDDDPGDIR
jgi:hypothetical protein